MVDAHYPDQPYHYSTAMFNPAMYVTSVSTSMEANYQRKNALKFTGNVDLTNNNTFFIGELILLLC